MEKAGKLRCQRIGCDAMFTEDDNPEGSCSYHDSPIFHDGMKEWSCCKKRSHDFSLFLQIPGCKEGKHTTEKPVLKRPAATPKPIPKPAPGPDASAKEACSRCRQGFFCSDHGSQVKVMNSNPPITMAVTPAESNTEEQKVVSAPAKKIVGINEPQTCGNKGCGKTFKEKDNHETACDYHPGPAVFHDRMRGWKCCDIHVKEFDEFMTIPPCSKGWHNADPVS
ncbi:Cysteine and histidine-rich domain-containing protein [Actinidia chinensis var. chinensis]|uniref:Cysteine and histidine-rich domain-containing protein n=1 Tax=Actinidia chinensis var. chinensis TaxID=1590841 RepID=A0A2R6RWE9_ACTCC|nr:Cysteine and histidine-rich domain-containing protein [Actinidia chinensis var. chinensis]